MSRRIDLILGIIFVLYFITIQVLFGQIYFSKFYLMVGLILIGYHFAKYKINSNKILVKISKTLKPIITIAIIIFIIAESLIIIYPKTNTEDCDYMIILGAGINNTKPGKTLQGRLDKAIEYIKEYNDDCYIVVSGGRGSDERLSEAEVMKRYLVENNIDEDVIIKEEQSTNTHENLLYSKEVIESHSRKDIEGLKIKVVTTDFHAFRSSILAKRNGYREVTFYTNKSYPLLVPVYYARELLSIGKTIVYGIVI